MDRSEVIEALDKDLRAELSAVELYAAHGKAIPQDAIAQGVRAIDPVPCTLLGLDYSGVALAQAQDRTRDKAELAGKLSSRKRTQVGVRRRGQRVPL